MVKSDFKYISWKVLILLLSKKYKLNIISQKWSHIKIQVDWIKTVVPNHKEIAYWTFSSILKQLKKDEDEFLKNLNK